MNKKQRLIGFVSAVDFIMSNIMLIMVYIDCNMDSIVVQQYLTSNISTCSMIS